MSKVHNGEKNGGTQKNNVIYSGHYCRCQMTARTSTARAKIILLHGQRKNPFILVFHLNIYVRTRIFAKLNSKFNQLQLELRLTLISFFS